MLTRSTLAPIAAAILALTGLTGPAPSASAGTNGQQVRVCSSVPGANEIIYIGTNEKGQKVQSQQIALSETAIAGGNYAQCGLLKGWWWVGPIQFNFYSGSGSPYLGSGFGNVPKTSTENVISLLCNWIEPGKDQNCRVIPN